MPPRKSWVTPKVKIEPIPEEGKGMIVVEPIKKGEVVLVYGGEFINTEQAIKERVKGKLVMQWDDDLWSAEDRGDDPSYFVNHSCDANTWMQDTWTLIAKRDIAVGEELTADYALWEADENYISKWECHCGASSCRKRITGKDWMLPHLQERYRGHFIPLINKKIKDRIK